MFSDRHQEACELIWERIAHAKRVCEPSDTGMRILEQIEQILEMTESRIQDDLEEASKGHGMPQEGLKGVYHV